MQNNSSPAVAAPFDSVSQQAPATLTKKFRVRIQYRFLKRTRMGVDLGMTIEAEDEGDALDKAWRKEIKPYRSRVFIAASAEVA